MATRTPPLQTRSQFGRSWGNFASATALPNASGAPLSAPFFSILEVGDTAYSVADGATYTCTSVGTVAGGDAVWSSGGGGGSGPSLLWSWNGVDTSQFDATPVVSAGQAGALSVLAADETQNRPSAVLNAEATYAGAGGALVFRVAPAEALVLPSRFRLRLGITQVEAGTRVGFFLFNAASWGASLRGGGTTFGATFTRQIIATAGASFPPFNLPSSTLAFAAVSATESQGGYIVDFECSKLDGAGIAPPALVGRLASVGSSTVPAQVDSYTLDRGMLFGTGAQGSAPTASFNGLAIDSLGLVLQSTSLGTFNAKIDRFELWSAP